MAPEGKKGQLLLSVCLKALPLLPQIRELEITGFLLITRLSFFTSKKISQPQVCASKWSQVKIVISITLWKWTFPLSAVILPHLWFVAMCHTAISFQTNSCCALQFFALFPCFPTVFYPNQVAYFDLLVHFPVFLFHLSPAPYIHQHCIFLSVSLPTSCLSFLLSLCHPQHLFMA